MFGGEEYITTTAETLESLGHSFTSYVSNNDATCTEDGTETAKCDRCDVTDTRTDEGSALGHDWAVEWTTDGTAHWHECSRCDEINGKTNHSGGTATCIALAKCEVCGVAYGEALGHDLQHHDAQAATCTEIGWNAYDTCSRCDYTTYEELPALGHAEGEAVRENEVAATCTVAGSYDEVVYCSVCDEELSREEKTIEALGHDLEHHEAQAATCTEIGWNAYDTCSRCDYTTYEEIPALGHTEGEAVRENEVAATCTVAGSYDEVVYCSVCGEELSREEKTIEALGHDLEHHEAQAATCTEIGWNAYDTCSRCDYTTYEELPALGHAEGEAVRENEVAATCTVAGSYDEVVYCSVCDEELSREEKTIEALGHSFTSYVSNNDATCTEDGTETAKCDRCDVTDTRTDEGSALGHDWAVEWTTDGTAHWHECSRCDEINGKTNHSGGTATCIALAKCEVCGVEYGEFAEHVYKDGYCTICGVIDSSALETDKDDAKTDLDDIAQDAKDEIDGSDLPDDVKEDLKDKVDEIINGAKDEVEGSTDFDDIDQAVENTKDEIEDAILDAEKDDAKSDLDEIAQGAKDEVDGSDLPDDVKDDLKDKIDEIVNDAKTEIDGETSKEEVDQTVEDAQQEIEDAILNAEKDDAKSDLDKIAQSAKDEIGSSGISDEEKAELKDKVDAAIEDAKEAIDNATSKEEIENIVNDTREDIDDLLKGSLDNELAEKKDAAISDLTEIAQDAKDGIDGSDISDEEKDELKGKVDEIVNDAKDEIEAATTPEEIDEILAEAENEIAAVTEDLKAGQLNTSTLWPWIIVAIVISAALSTLFAWRHVKKVQGKGEAVGAKSVVTIAVATILIFVVVIGITLLIFAMV